MKFSVLLPTRNRLEFLKYSLQSVLSQDYQNWEVILSDNFSDQDIQGYIQSLNEPRIKYSRTESFLSVTENWNRTIEKITGDYVIMLGDDDCLMQGYFTTICNLMKQYPDPDLIYTSGYLYAYPGVVQEFPQGFLRKSGNARFFQSRQEPFWIRQEEAFQLVSHSLNFEMFFLYNMQYVLISNALIKKIQKNGKFFHSSYPDYYAMNALMLHAERILACPDCLVIVGICPKSAGAFFWNQKEKQAAELLNDSSPLEKQMESIVLPGAAMTTSWLLAMEALKENFKDFFPLEVNYKRYRTLQILEFYKNWTKNGAYDEGQLSLLWKKMERKEKLFYGAPLHLISFFLRAIGKLFGKKFVKQLVTVAKGSPKHFYQEIPQNFATIQEVWNHLNPPTKNSFLL